MGDMSDSEWASFLGEKPPQVRTGISRREVAKRHGINERTIRKRIADGSLAPAVLPDGTLDPEKAAELIAATVVRAKAAPIALTSARTKKLKAQVEKLHDEVAALAASVIEPEDAAAEWGNVVAHMAGPIGRLPAKIGTKVAGRPGREAAVLIRDLVHAALEEATAEDLASEPMVEEAVEDEVDLATLSPTGLLAIKFDLEAERIHLEHALARGDVLLMEEWATGCEEKLAVSKSLLLALPGRLAAAMEHASRGEARRLAKAEVEGAMAALA